MYKPATEKSRLPEKCLIFKPDALQSTDYSANIDKSPKVLFTWEIRSNFPYFLNNGLTDLNTKKG